MRRSVVFMFSGQGSHYYQMGKELFEQNSVFRKWMLKGKKAINLAVPYILIRPSF